MAFDWLRNALSGGNDPGIGPASTLSSEIIAGPAGSGWEGTGYPNFDSWLDKGSNLMSGSDGGIGGALGGMGSLQQAGVIATALSMFTRIIEKKEKEEQAMRDWKAKKEYAEDRQQFVSQYL